MLEEIDAIAEAMQDGNLSLDDSIKNYEKAMKLIILCKDKILKAEKSIKVLEKGMDDNWTESDFAEHIREDGSIRQSSNLSTSGDSPKKKSAHKSTSKRNKKLDNSLDVDEEPGLF